MIVNTPTSRTIEASRAGEPIVGGGVLRAIVTSRAEGAGSLASQVAVGASRARGGEVGPRGAEVSSGANTPLLQVA